MVRAGEESGKLDQIFAHLADHLDRTYEVAQKAKNALIYPAFVVFTFGVVMILMLTLVIPKISQILIDSGQEIPVYTQVVIGLSNFFVNYGIFLAVALVAGIYLLLQFRRTAAGSESFDAFVLNVPYLGDLYDKLYLSRISDNLTTLLSSGIPMIKSLELTSSTIDNVVYRRAVDDATEKVKAGSPLSEAMARQGIVPNILIQMIRVGEETGNVGEILGRMANFYQREVTNAVDTLVNLIEPAMIVFLGAGVGILLASVLIPIYNVSATF
jgi:type IV pilus assembly protein PilC